MPEISRFFGIVIQMYFREHGVPHFHAIYGGAQASFAITTLARLEGQLPRRAHTLVMEWADEHRAELLANWEHARRQEALLPIAPLE